MYKIILILFMFVSLLVTAKDKAPSEKTLLNRVYQNIERDIILVRKKAKYSTRFKVRLFELYIERFNYLRKKENAIFLESKNISVVKRKKAELRKNLMGQYNDISTLARQLEANKGSYAKRELGRVYTILAEISRDLNFEKKHLYYLRKADKYVYRKKYRYQINTFFAEYYYNNKKYKQALKYYKSVLSNPDNYWYSKHLYNASWCYLKLDNFDQAIKLITMAHKTSQTSSYVNLGPQALDHLSLFYAFSGRTGEAIRVLPTLTGDPYSILIKFSDDTVRFGKKEHVDQVFNVAEKYVTLPTKKIEYLLHKMKIYRKLTRYNDLQDTIFEMAKIYKEVKSIPKEVNEELVSEIKSYTGLLQERFVKGNIKEEKKDLALSMIMKNFDILSLINPPETHEYLYFQGETLYGYKKFSNAVGFYQKSISFIEQNRKKEKDLKPLIDKRLNSIFSSLELMQANNSTKEGYYEYAYQKYLEYFPDTVKAQSMYQKVFTLYFKNNKHQSSIDTITRYNKYFPQDHKFQKSMYDDVMRYYIKRKDAVRLSKLIEKPKEGYLGYTKKDVIKFQEILYQIYFTVYNKQLAAKDYESSTKGFASLFENDKVPYSVRYRAGLKALEIYSKNFKNDADKISQWSVRLMKGSSQEDFLADRSRHEYIIQMFASNGHLKESYKLIDEYRKNAKRFKLKNKDIKSVLEVQLLLALALDEKRDALKVFENYRQAEDRESFRAAYNKEMLNHFMMTGKESYIKGYVKRYKDIPEFASDFDIVISTLAWQEYDKDGNSSDMKKFITKELKPEIYKLSYAHLNEEQGLKNLKASKLVSFKNGPVTFESFSKEIETVIQSLQVTTASYDNFIKTSNAKAVVRGVKIVSEKVSNLADSIEAYVPETPDKELKKAIIIEAKKLAKVVSSKKNEYLKIVENINSKVALFDNELFELKREKSLSEFLTKPISMKLFTNTINEVNE